MNPTTPSFIILIIVLLIVLIWLVFAYVKALEELAGLKYLYRKMAVSGVNRRVKKLHGFQYTGTVVAEFETLDGKDRVVVEFDAPYGGSHYVYKPDQLEDL